MFIDEIKFNLSTNNKISNCVEIGPFSANWGYKAKVFGTNFVSA